jgi:hypothetical protein
MIAPWTRAMGDLVRSYGREPNRLLETEIEVSYDPREKRITSTLFAPGPILVRAKVCAETDPGDTVTLCECGAYRPIRRAHGWRRRSRLRRMRNGKVKAR